MKPIRIGITSPLVGEEVLSDDTEVTRHGKALTRAGAEPIILRKDMDPLRVVEELDLQGILFSGGGDVNAGRYAGDETLANVGVDPLRDAFEFVLLEHAFECVLPILAVCRGMQVTNVLLGGTLIEDIRQHLGDEYSLPHNQVKDAGLGRTAYSHEIGITSGTALHGFAGAARVSVNSLHHQALGKVAPALHVTARADDGMIEAIEFTSDYAGANGSRRFFIGVQWHPELLPEDRLSQHLYARFVDACKAP